MIMTRVLNRLGLWRLQFFKKRKLIGGNILIAKLGIHFANCISNKILFYFISNSTKDIFEFMECQYSSSQFVRLCGFEPNYTS